MKRGAIAARPFGERIVDQMRAIWNMQMLPLVEMRTRSMYVIIISYANLCCLSQWYNRKTVRGCINIIPPSCYSKLLCDIAVIREM